MAFSRLRIRTAIALMTTLVAAGCHEQGDVRVKSISFSGNQAVTESQLRDVLATQQSGWLPWSVKHYFDRGEFEQDLKRVETFYHNRGYPNARIRGVDLQFNQAKDAVNVRINIEEGKPIIAREIAVEGFGDLTAAEQDTVRSQLPLKSGQPRDEQLVTASRDFATRTLREHGYAYAVVRATEQPLGNDEVRVTLVAEAGPKAHFGSISVVGNTSVGENVILRQLTFKPGDDFKSGRITESQRRLYGLELFQFALVEPRLEEKSVEVPVRVTVTEGKHRRLQLGIGYGSEEKARATANWRHLNFMGGARSATTEVKWSSLDRGMRVGLTEPYLFRPGGSFQLTGSNWWTFEPTYELRSYGGRATIINLLGSGSQSTADHPVRTELRAAYIREFERYAISKEALNDFTLTSRFIALGLDPVTGAGEGTLSALEVDLERNTSARPLDPRSGYVASLHVESAGGPLAGSFQYNEIIGDGRIYLPFGDRAVWANRLRFGTLAGAESSRVPFYKRYFLGGSTSLRGWGRYEVSPLSDGGIPIGGRSMLESSTELRLRLSRSLTAVAFVDAGNVWSDALQFRGNLRYSVGPGLRYDTRIGPVRGDLGFQLNPIPGLLINGKPELRKWRVHFSIGQAF